MVHGSTHSTFGIISSTVMNILYPALQGSTVSTSVSKLIR